MKIDINGVVCGYYIKNDILYWNTGDVFDMEFDLNLRTADGDVYNLTEKDNITLIFFKIDNLDNVIPCYSQQFSNIKDNKIVLNITQEVTKYFNPGRYFYSFILNNDKEKLSSNNRNKIEVLGPED